MSMSRKLWEEFSINLTVENTYFSDHDAVKTAIDKTLLIFILFYKIQYDQGI